MFKPRNEQIRFLLKTDGNILSDGDSSIILETLSIIERYGVEVSGYHLTNEHFPVIVDATAQVFL